MYVQTFFTCLDERPFQSLQEREQASGTMPAPASGTETHEEHWLAAGIARFSKTNKEQNQTGRGNSKPETFLNRKYWGLCLIFTGYFVAYH